MVGKHKRWHRTDGHHHTLPLLFALVGLFGLLLLVMSHLSTKSSSSSTPTSTSTSREHQALSKNNNKNQKQQQKNFNMAAARPPPLTAEQRYTKEKNLRDLFPEPTKPFVLKSLPQEDSRVIIIGDIHACLEEFNKLLEKCEYNAEKDVLILLGDLVGKGPNSIGVLDRAMELHKNHHCYVLVGNHDWTLLRWYEAQRVMDPPQTDVAFSSKEGNPYPEMSLEITKEHYEFLKSWPLAIELPMFNVTCVHAGVNPLLGANSVENDGTVVAGTNGYDMMHMRNVVKADAVPSLVKSGEDDASTEDSLILSEALPGEPWAAQYKGPNHVVFGHDAMRKLQQYPFATGLDTGCCYGGQLTAMVLPGMNIVSVKSEFNCLAK